MSNKENIPKLRFKEFSGEWEEKCFGDISTIIMGQSPDSSSYNEKNIGLPLIQGNADCKNRKTRPRIYTTKITKECQIGDIIMTVRAPVGAISKAIHNACIGRGVCTIRPKEDGEFIYQFLIKYEDNWLNYSQGSTFTAVNSKDIRNLKITLPQKQEQEKIASFLSSIDKKINQLSKKDELLQNYKKAMMQKIFSQKLRFKKEDRSDYTKWEEKKLKEIATFFSGGTPSSTNKNYYNGDIPFIGSGKINSDNVEQFITSDALENSSAKMVNVGDLLYALYGATSGQVAISKIRGAINQAVLCIRSEENLAFLYFWLSFKQDNIISTYLQGGQGNLSAQIIKDLKINLPYIEEQTKIANFLSSLDTKISQNKKALEETQKFKKALLQKMLV